MASRPIGNGNISFGMVSIPVRLFGATRSRSVSLNLLHAKDLSRIQQRIYCPVEDAIIDRSELVRGYEVEKGRYVTFTDEELRDLEVRAGRTIEINEFVPLSAIDPLYFEEAYYLGCEAGAEKAYRLLADAMAAAGRVARRRRETPDRGAAAAQRAPAGARAASSRSAAARRRARRGSSRRMSTTHGSRWPSGWARTTSCIPAKSVSMSCCELVSKWVKPAMFALNGQNP